MHVLYKHFVQFNNNNKVNLHVSIVCPDFRLRPQTVTRVQHLVSTFYAHKSANIHRYTSINIDHVEFCTS